MRTIARYPAEFLTALGEAPAAPWIYTGGLENYPRLIARMARIRPLLGNGPEVISRVRDPHWLAEVLNDAMPSGIKVRFPRTIAGNQPPATGDWLSKSLRSAGGMGIRRNGSPVNGTNTPVNSSRRPLRVWQQFVPGDAMSASFLANDDEVALLGTSQQWLGPAWGAPQEFHYAGGISPALLTAEETFALREIATTIASKSAMRGLFGIDFIRSEWGLSLIEVNPRLTASMELLQPTVAKNLITHHCQAFWAELDTRQLLSKTPMPSVLANSDGNATNEPLTSTSLVLSASERYRAKLIVYATTTGSAGPAWQEAAESLDRAVYGDAGVAEPERIAVADRPSAGTLMESSSPICTLLTSGDDPRQVAGRLLAAGARLRAALMPVAASTPRASPT